MEKTIENVDKLIRSHIDEDDSLTEEEIVLLRDAYLSTGEVQNALHPVNGPVANYINDYFLMYIQGTLYREFDRYKPDVKRAFEEQAENIQVTVGDKEFGAYLDALGTLRFRSQTVFKYFADLLTYNRVTVDGKPFTLNELYMAYHEGNFTNEDWLEFMTSINYSIGGFSDLTEFSHLDINYEL